MKKRIVLLATNWGSSEGGINSFNYDLALGFSSLLNETFEIVCVIPDNVLYDNLLDIPRNIELLKVKNFDDCYSIVKKITEKQGIVSLWIGHDIFTGRQASTCASYYNESSLTPSCSAVIHHMDYSNYYFIKEDDADKYPQKENLQKEVLVEADYVFAVGPKLRRSAEDILRSKGINYKQVVEIIPGLAQIQTLTEPLHRFSCISFGRMSDDIIKQGSLSVAAFATFFKQVKDHETYMHIVGIEKDKHHAIRNLTDKYAEGIVNVKPRGFLKREVLFELLSEQTVSMMLSLREGFGLAGWEAISAEIPLILSEQSGLFIFLQELLGKDIHEYVYALNINGDYSEIFNDKDIDNVVNYLLNIHKKRMNAKKQAGKLKEILQEKGFTWENTAKAIYKACVENDVTKLNGHSNIDEVASAVDTILDIDLQEVERTNIATENMTIEIVKQNGQKAELKIMSQKRADQVLNDMLTAVTVGIIGPSGNGKSTVFAYLVSPNDNMILGQNIGDKSQTSLVNTILALNATLEPNQVCIQCKRKTVSTPYNSYIIESLQEMIYKSRDDLENFELNSSILKSVFDPITKEYHAFDYITDNEISTNELFTFLIGISEFVIQGDEKEEDLESTVNKIFKELKDQKRKPNKRDIYEQEIERRFYMYNDGNLTSLKNWFARFEQDILDDYQKFWDIENDYMLYGDITADLRMKEFMASVYAANSVFSLVFSEVIYVTRPSDEFVEAYDEQYKKQMPSFSEKPFILNILDTMGVTHISDKKEEIEKSMDKILSNSTLEALLFLCGADEKETIYEHCISILNTKDVLKEIPVTICRTKADIIIQNKMSNHFRSVTGENEIPEQHLEFYTTTAFESFKAEYIELTEWPQNENKIGLNLTNSNNTIEYLALSPNSTKDLKRILKSELEESRVFKIIFNLSIAVDRHYSSEGMFRVHSINKKTAPIQTRFALEEIDEISNQLVELNLTDSNNKYYKYINRGIFHGRSISTFRSKHIQGFGHST
ncbi:glycosyltransferase, partial [Paenibacillus sp. MAEPY1]